MTVVFPEQGPPEITIKSAVIGFFFEVRPGFPGRFQVGCLFEANPIRLGRSGPGRLLCLV